MLEKLYGFVYFQFKLLKPVGDGWDKNEITNDLLRELAALKTSLETFLFLSIHACLFLHKQVSITIENFVFV
jgi:hypothetical protein